MAIPVSELQSINPGSIIELFSIELNTALHGSNTIYRFHNGANMNANGEVVWAGNSYLRFPIECNGFEFGSTGTLGSRISLDLAQMNTNLILHCKSFEKLIKF